nr:hypothetical protein Iba_chr09aCG10870 [Ipomoea batatas]
MVNTNPMIKKLDNLLISGLEYFLLKSLKLRMLFIPKELPIFIFLGNLDLFIRCFPCVFARMNKNHSLMPLP